MGMNKISGLSALTAAAIPLALAAGEVFMLPVGQGIIGSFGAVSAPQIGTSNPLTGQFVIEMGQYTCLQIYDSTTDLWRNVQVSPYQALTISSDGANYRLANTTGCPVGALITAAGSGGTNGFYGYNNSGQAITWQNGIQTLGNTVFTITFTAATTVYQNGVFGGTGPSLIANPGSGYVRAPMIVFAPPPNQGNQPCILPAATCTISGGAINAITVTQQGAGLLGLPVITVIPAPGDITGGGAVLGWTAGNSGQVGSGTVMAMAPAFYGTAVTAVPTFTFGGTSNPAPTVTAIMNFTITSFTATTPGVGYVAAGGVFQGGIVGGSAANTNPAYDKALSLPIFPPVTVAATTGLPSLAGPFGGVNLQAVPTFSAFSTGAAASTAAVTTVNVGGANDLITLFSF